jgi:dTDP-4-dehydrorhamnose reductase
MAPKILLIGMNGQLGTDLAPLLPGVGKVAALGRQQLDLTKPDDLRRTIRDLAPRVIVNAAAYTAVDRAETEESIARSVNATAPAVLAEEAKKIGALLVHYSTDYIFDGQKTTPYTESDAANPINAYGTTKWEGEQAIRESGAEHFIFRTAWVYATHGRNFLLTILRLATEREELKVVRDQIGAPTWSREIAAATTQILARIFASGEVQPDLPKSKETYHMTAAGSGSWYDFASAILEECSAAPNLPAWTRAATGGKPITARRVVPIETREFPTLARRPAYSILSNSKLSASFKIQLPDWRAQLRAAFLSES